MANLKDNKGVVILFCKTLSLQFRFEDPTSNLCKLKENQSKDISSIFISALFLKEEFYSFLVFLSGFCQIWVLRHFLPLQRCSMIQVEVFYGWRFFRELAMLRDGVEEGMSNFIT